MDYAIGLIREALAGTAGSLAHNWPFLAVGIAVAAALKTFVDAGRVSALLRRWRGAGVAAATAAAILTPFCSCGTTAVILGMMAGDMPLAPIVAFMVASPLSSPEELVYGAGLFGWPFALFHFGASAALGLAGGALAGLLERRGLLRGQARLATLSGGADSAHAVPPGRRTAFAPAAQSPTVLLPEGLRPASGAACAACAVPAGGNPAGRGQPAAWKADAVAFGHAVMDAALRLLPMFIGFAFIGYLLNGLLPASLVSALFGQGKAHGVPLAATLGLPLYISSEGSLPLVRALLDSGMSQGAVMAFLIAGSGTSVGAMAGALTIVRWKTVGLVVAVLWFGAIFAGYGFEALAALA